MKRTKMVKATCQLWYGIENPSSVKESARVKKNVSKKSDKFLRKQREERSKDPRPVAVNVNYGKGGELNVVKFLVPKCKVVGTLRIGS